MGRPHVISGLRTAVGATSGVLCVLLIVLRLHSYTARDYVKDWAQNFMVKIGVDDVEAWHQRAQKIASGGEFDNISVKSPEDVDGFRVLHVVDPSGVLLVFVE